MYSSFLELELTNTCNLNCKYCYEKDFLKSLDHKDAKILSYNDAKELILKYHEIQKSKIAVELFGGEPFLAKDTIKEILADDEINRIARFSGISNCTIYDKELSELLIMRQCNIEFSIDAPRIHHENRVWRNSELSSYDHCWETYQKWYLDFKNNNLSIPRIRTTYIDRKYLDDTLQYILYLNINKIPVFVNYCTPIEDFMYLKLCFKKLTNLLPECNLNDEFTYIPHTCPLECYKCLNKNCQSSLSIKKEKIVFDRYNGGVLDDNLGFTKVSFANTGDRFKKLIKSK